MSGARRDEPRAVVSIGASAGGVEAVLDVVRKLPADLDAAILVVIHTSQSSPGTLSDLLGRAGVMRALRVDEAAPIERGTIYVAPPGRHILVNDDGSIRPFRGPKENGFRPAIDPLLRTVAHVFGRRAIGVILTGNLDDGALGLAAIKRHGGVAVVQDPEESRFHDMPQRALALTDVDHVVTVGDLPDLLERLIREMPEGGGEAMTREPEPIEEGVRQEDAQRPPTPFTCPDCGGSLWEEEESPGLTHFTCRVGHTFTIERLLDLQGETLETLLWAALRAIEENADLSERIVERMDRRNGNVRGLERFRRRAADARRTAEVLRDILTDDAVATSE